MRAWGCGYPAGVDACVDLFCGGQAGAGGDGSVGEEC